MRAGWWVALGAAVIVIVSLMALLWPAGAKPPASYVTRQGVIAERAEYPCASTTEVRCADVTVDVDGETVSLGTVAAASSLGRQHVGDSILVGYVSQSDTWFFVDQDRRGRMALLAGVFGALVIAVGRRRGARALVGLAASAAILVGFCAPALLDGRNAVAVCLVSAAAICTAAVIVSHGCSPSSIVAIGSMYASLAVTYVLGVVAFPWLGLSGALGDEATLIAGTGVGIDFAGLLLGGTVLGALGALDDVVMTQVAAVEELAETHDRKGVVASAMRIGRHHIAAGVNTLLLAYAGASMPLLLLFSLDGTGWATAASSELIATEIARTLVGSVGLLLAIPLATWAAAAVLRNVDEPDADYGDAGDDEDDEDEGADEDEDGGDGGDEDGADEFAGQDEHSWDETDNADPGQ
jgi:uncharacterized membrane protein